MIKSKLTNNHFSAYKHYEAMRIMTNVYIETLPTELKLYEKTSYTKYLYLLTHGPCISIFLQAIIDE